MAFCLIFLFLFLTFLAERASRPPPSRVAPKAASQGGGGGLEGAKMALGLACGQGWWRSCSAAAIFPRGGRRPVWREAGRARRRRVGAPEPRAGRRVLWMEPARPPRPQTQRLAR